MCDDEFCVRHGYPLADGGQRLRLLLDAYRLQGRAGLVDLVRSRELALYDMVRLCAATGDPAFVQVWQDTRGGRWLDAISSLDRERDK